MNVFKLLGLAGLATAASAALAGPKVTNVRMVQDQTSGKVTISYHLDKPAVVTVDVVTNALQGAGASIGPVNLLDMTGDAFRRVDAGDRTIVWKPSKSAIGAAGFVSDGASVRARVTAWSTNCPPDYLVVDLTSQAADKYANARFYPSADYLLGGLTNAAAYRESKLVLKKVPAAGVEWRMGSPSFALNRSSGDYARTVVLSRDYYIGVFEMTRQQCINGCGYMSTADRDKYATLDEWKGAPVPSLSWASLRGASDGRTTSAAPTVGSYLGKLRSKTGGIAFDLPTSAQWEFACRGGTATATPNGDYLNFTFCYANGTSGPASAETKAKLNEIAWTIYNGTNVVNGAKVLVTHPVGRLRPNAFGLYDMLGNAHELVIDYRGTLDELNAAFGGKGFDEPIVDPCLTTAGATAERIRRGGAVGESSWLSTQSFVTSLTAAEDKYWSGFRVVCPVGL